MLVKTVFFFMLQERMGFQRSFELNLKKWTDINPVEESVAEKISVRGISNPKQTMPTCVLKPHNVFTVKIKIIDQ